MLPLETICAAFPSSARIGKCAVGPMTLLHAVAMEALGVDVLDANANDGASSCVGLWLLSKGADGLRAAVAGGVRPSEVGRWMSRAGIGPSEAKERLDGVFREAFSTYVRPKPGGGKTYTDGLPDGYGWPIELAECLCHEYCRPFDEVMSWPLSRAFALVAVMRQRNGCEAGGPDYYGRIREAALAERLARQKASRG